MFAGIGPSRGPFGLEEEAELRWALLQALQVTAQQQLQQQEQLRQQKQALTGQASQGYGSSYLDSLEGLLPGFLTEGEIEARLDAYFQRLHWVAQVWLFYCSVYGDNLQAPAHSVPAGTHFRLGVKNILSGSL